MSFAEGTHSRNELIIMRFKKNSSFFSFFWEIIDSRGEERRKNREGGVVGKILERYLSGQNTRLE